MKRILMIAAVMVLALQAQNAPQTQTQAQEKQPEPAEKKPDLREMMALMDPTQTVLQIGELALTWRELRPVMVKMEEEQRRSAQGREIDSQLLERMLRLQLQIIAQRGLFLLESRARKLEVTPAEREAYLKQMDQMLTMRKLKREDFLKRFNPGTSTLSLLNLEDTLRIVKLDKQEFPDEKVNLKPEEFQTYRRILEERNKQIQARNDERKEGMQDLRKRPEIDTARGFAILAKQVSEGMESDDGGELPDLFTREELAEANELKEFPWKVGETTPLLETTSCWRIMRVLEVAVPAKDGQPEKLRVAQILMGKFALEDTRDAAISFKVIPNKKKYMLEQFAKELSKKYPVITLFFPQGLWEENQAAAPAAPQP